MQQGRVKGLAVEGGPWSALSRGKATTETRSVTVLPAATGGISGGAQTSCRPRKSEVTTAPFRAKVKGRVSVKAVVSGVAHDVILGGKGSRRGRATRPSAI